jgi:hypothetical protein
MAGLRRHTASWPSCRPGADTPRSVLSSAGLGFIAELIPVLLLIGFLVIGSRLPSGDR